MMARHGYDLPLGATVLGDGRTRFRLWAPGCEAVALEIEGTRPLTMRCEADGWFVADTACPPRARYRYRVRPDLVVPDPASRAQADDVHGASVVVDPRAFEWHHESWMGRPWHETVVYEVHAGLAGGFRGLTARLPALADLGVTAIELMPVADFPGPRNWGYDGVLPFAPDAAYGSPDDLKSMIDAAHGLGLMVFLDVVYNHFGPDGNWLGSYAPQFFRNDLQTPWGAAIDYRLPQVRRFFIENALYWFMEYRVDGLRLDAVHAISEPDWLDELAQQVRATVEPGRHVHLVLEHDGNAARHLERGFDAQWNDDAHHALHVLLTGERHGYYVDYADGPAHRLARCLAEGFAYQGERSTWRDGAPRGEPSAHLPPTRFVLFLQNHDQTGNRALGERLTCLADPQALYAATALVLLSPQIPLLFMGEEWGCRNPFLYFTSHEPQLAAAVREGRRREFAGFPDFTLPEDRLRIPDPNDIGSYVRSTPDWASRWSVTGAARADEFRRLLRLRQRMIAPRLDGARTVGAREIGDAAVSGAWTLSDGARLTLAINLGADPVACAPAEAPLLWATSKAAAEAAAIGTLLPFSLVAVLATGP